MKKLSEIVQNTEELIQMVDSLMKNAVDENDIEQIKSIHKSKLDNNFYLGILHWRLNINPQKYLNEVVSLSHKLGFYTSSIEKDKGSHDNPSNEQSLYAAYLLNITHPPLSLKDLDYTLARAFFGNVLIGAADIADWPKYRDALPRVRRTELARRTNELYADLLAGRMAPDVGVKLGEKFWEERENNEWFLDGGEGGGDENHRLVDYQLGAILKKIGSTVPTVHAWVW